jgi:hypothetical protein
MTDNDHDGILEDGRDWPQPYAVSGPFVAIRHRAHGSSVFFGPFATYAELRGWVSRAGFDVEVVNLLDPESPRNLWWGTT